MRGLSVKVIQGIVRGCKEKLPNDRNYLRFSGIPYAQKPIGELRFKSPQKLLKFEKPEIDCTIEGEKCFHKYPTSSEYIGSEDCLYLNVYVPEYTESKKFPVMVYIHGGAFTTGSGSIQSYSPEYLLMEDVIMVSVNYRLHALGFLSFPSMGISGNAGLKDQQMALEWIYENISNFNGDPDNICLFGESAGAVSVHFQLLNSKSRKFIKSAICQSGCALADWSVQRDPIMRTKNLARLLGCSNVDDDSEIYKTLMSASLENLFRYSLKAGDPDEQKRCLVASFRPSIEIDSEDAFISKSPIELIKDEDIKIPVIFGTTDKDGMIQTANLLSDLESFNTDPVRMIPMSINVDSKSSVATELGNQIKKFYFGDSDVGENNLDVHFDLMTDIHFLVPQIIASELHARYQHDNKQYLYEFRFDGELNLLKKIINMEKFKGACHADDLFYIFGRDKIKVELSEDSPAIKMRSTMSKMWTNFAKYQNPTPEFDNPISVSWEPVEYAERDSKSVDLKYLIIDHESKMDKNVNYERIDFWRNIYKIYNEKFTNPKL